MSSELKSTFTGRQEILGSVQLLDFVEDLIVGDTPIGTLPEGSILTGGWLQVLTVGSAASAIVIELRDPNDGSVFATLATGDAVTLAKTDLVPTGIPTAKAYNIVVTNAVVQTSGDGYLHLEYVIKGRAEYSQG